MTVVFSKNDNRARLNLQWNSDFSELSNELDMEYEEKRSPS